MASLMEGKRKIEWAGSHMPVLNRLREDEMDRQPFAGRRIGICLHIEAKTAYLALVLQDLGAEVAIAGCNPLSTQDDVAAALADQGVGVFSHYGATAEQYERYLDQVVDTGPELIIDDGGDLVTWIHTRRPEALAAVIGGAEETTTGVVRLRAMQARNQLRFPMLAVNDALSKYLFDNRYGTGQSVWDGIVRATNLVVAGKHVVVAGYGWCGKGVALRARGMGARVTVTEVDPIAANEALMDGCDVRPMAGVASEGDLFITVTGCRDVIGSEHIRQMKDGVMLANAGHFDVEIRVDDLLAMDPNPRDVRKDIQEFRDPDTGKRRYLLGQGRLVNLACADGHPAEIMDMSFGLQLLALQYLNDHRELTPGVHRVTDAIDQQIARLRLESLGIMIDTLTEDQQAYLSGWQV